MASTALLSVLLAACATAPPRPAPTPIEGSGSYTPMHGADTRRYELSVGQSFSSATLAHFENPVYPPALPPLKLAPVTLVVQLVIGSDGRVLHVQPDPPAQLQLIDHAAEFMVAIEACTRQWQFAPLVISTQHELDGHTISTSSAKPFSLVYAFSFELRDGQPHAGLARQ